MNGLRLPGFDLGNQIPGKGEALPAVILFYSERPFLRRSCFNEPIFFTLSFVAGGVDLGISALLRGQSTKWYWAREPV